jgi:hypothetical protein
MPGIVSGSNWLSERRRFLQEELAKEPPEEQRTILESELAAIDQEIGRNRRHWWRWLFGARPPI